MAEARSEQGSLAHRLCDQIVIVLPVLTMQKAYRDQEREKRATRMLTFLAASPPGTPARSRVL